MTPTTLLITECDGKFFHNITLTPTIPVWKNVLTVTFYLPNGLWLKSKNKKCSVQLEGTKSVTVEVGAQCTTLYGFKKLVVITPKITHAEDSNFWGAFGLPTIWVCLCECLCLQVLHYNRHTHHPHLLHHHLPHQQQQQQQHHNSYNHYENWKNSERKTVKGVQSTLRTKAGHFLFRADVSRAWLACFRRRLTLDSSPNPTCPFPLRKGISSSLNSGSIITLDERYHMSMMFIRECYVLELRIGMNVNDHSSLLALLHALLSYITTSITYRLRVDNNQLSDGLKAQLVKHCTGVAGVRVRVAVEAWIFQVFFTAA